MKFLNLISSSTSTARWRQCGRPSLASPIAALSILVVAFALSGCGNTLYLVQINQAEESFQEAKEVGAEEYAPYEYYAAQARIREAQRQAAQAEYGVASDLSDEANEFATQAIVKSKTARRTAVTPGAGR